VTPFEHVVAVEGHPSQDGRLIRADALTWEGQLPMPVMGTGNPESDGPWSYTIVGTVEKIERVGHLIWASGSFFADPPPVEDGYGWCITVDDATWDPEPDALTKGRIRAVYLGLAAWPECVVTE
jgi:hypothetical protein